ncbi:Guanine nucleotide exchange factor lte1 [Elasticomyces elasticus]|nr:Guanine nucleotide exchange factor lte1 [Elasticomyces elasticus]
MHKAAGLARVTTTTRQPDPISNFPANSAKSSDAHNAAHTKSARDGKKPLRRARNSSEELRTRKKAEQRGNIAVDGESGGSSGKSGKAFIVGKVGNNGAIYLRPSTSQRPQPPPFVFPSRSTPPEPEQGRPSFQTVSDDGWRESVHSHPQWPVRKESRTQAGIFVLPKSLPLHQRRQNRSQSMSTIDDRVRSSTPDADNFKFVIDRPGASLRPRTAEFSLPLIEVPIPHYKLGTPRFSARGTAFLHNSMYSRASSAADMTSSVFSRAEYDQLFPAPPGRAHNAPSSNYNSTVSHGSRYLSPGAEFQTRSPTPVSLPSTHDTKNPISAATYENLSTQLDDSNVVRYAPSSGHIIAATPARLVTQITSQNFLDYELLSDFFLTYRSYLSATELLLHLLARLEWALGREDDFGRIVRVRTFVAMRHWILNYFADDFLPDHELRVRFCDLVNELSKRLRARVSGGDGDIKLVGELKKCWWRTCALYWDLPAALDSSAIGSEYSIIPGGIPGSRNSALVPPAHPMAAMYGRSTARLEAPVKTESDRRLALHSSRQPSHLSEHSIQVLSCSIPLGNAKMTARTEQLRFPQQLTSAQKPANGPPISLDQRPSHRHKRSGSFSDALRDNRNTMSSSRSRDADVRRTPEDDTSGSLIRGFLIQPMPPFIDSIALLSPALEVDTPSFGAAPEEAYLRPPSTPNARTKTTKIFGSVRRVLSSRQGLSQSRAASEHSFGSGDGEHTKRSNNTPRTFTKSESGGKNLDADGVLRLDALAAHVYSTMELLLAEDRQQAWALEPAGRIAKNKAIEQSAALQHQTHDQNQPTDLTRLDSHLTNGDPSNMRVDDMRSGFPAMSGALPSTSRRLSDLHPGYGSSLNLVATTRDPEGAANTDTIPDHLFRVPSGPAPLASPHMQQNASVLGDGHVYEISSLPGIQFVTDFTTNNGVVHAPPAVPALQQRSSDQSVALQWHSPLPGLQEDAALGALGRPTSAHPPEPASHSVRHQLRRRPGGNLKAVNNVHDLKQVVRRARSTGSLSTRTHSITNSVCYSPISPDAQQSPAHTTPRRGSGGSRRLLSQAVKRKSVTLIDTHSSQPNLRPSFEAEVARLAQMGDGEDDGGLEATLLKLEGRYDRSSPDKSITPRSPAASVEAQSIIKSHVQLIDHLQLSDNNRLGIESTLASPVTGNQGTSLYGVPQSTGAKSAAEKQRPRRSNAKSAESYSSIPLLERGFGDVIRPGKTRPKAHQRPPILPNPSEATCFPIVPKNTNYARSTAEHAEKTTNSRVNVRKTIPSLSSTTQGSFLLDENESLSDISSEVSDATAERLHSSTHGIRSFFYDDDVDEVTRGGDLMPPLRHPPTPPSTTGAATEQSPDRPFALHKPFRPNLGHPLQGVRNYSKVAPITTGLNMLEEPMSGADLTQATAPSQPSAHLPFILAYSSEAIAQQMTLLERDALEELDWKELIDCKWQQSLPKFLSWVTYLRSGNPHGVEISISRFNLVVGWAIAECVMTADVDERAACITKFIHIAALARRLRNYATTYQLTSALLSSNLSRLSKTWLRVSSADIATLKDLEALVQPVRNFHPLRTEMERLGPEDGCIPFIGIFTHDLLFNAQKPAYIEPSPPAVEPLVNFERLQTCAAVVKGLLRLMDASTRYNFQPHPELLSRCLWLAALPEDEIRKRSKALE